MAGDAAFQTDAEYQQAHEQLLAAVDHDDDAPAGDDDEKQRLLGALDAIRTFLRRGAAGGAYLDEPKERRACQALLDYWASQCYSQQLDIPRPLLAPHDASLLPTLADDACTYVGLDAFGENDARYFFGRDDQVTALVVRLRTERLMVVTGASGSGKSSLVLAGLLPALKRGRIDSSASWRYLPIVVPGVAPLQHLAQSLAAAAAADSGDRAAWVEVQVTAMQGDAGHAARLLAADPRPAVVIVDQFEEALTLRTEQTSPDYIAFVANLRGLVEVESPLHRVVLTMRKDVEPQLAREYPELNQRYGAAAFPVYSMESARLRDAIEKPAAQAGLKFQDGVVDELIKSVVGEDASLPLLQFSLMALWERRKGNLVTHEAYREVGSPRHAMAEAARRLYDTLPREQQLAAQRVFVALSRQGEGAAVFRNRASRSQLHGVAEATNVDAVLDKFADARLLRVTKINDDPSDDVAEVAHESLLRNWDLLDRLFAEQRVERERRAFLKKQAEKWREAGFDAAFLLSGLALQQARDEFRNDAVTHLEREFLDVSDSAEAARQREHAEAERRELAVQVARVEVAEQRARVEIAANEAAQQLAEDRRVANRHIATRLRVATVAAVVAVGFAGVAAIAWVRSHQAVQASESRMLGMSARTLAGVDAEASVLMAAEAVRRQPSMLAEMASVVVDASQFRGASMRMTAAQVGTADAIALDPGGLRLLVASVEAVTEWTLAGGTAAVARKLAWDARPQDLSLLQYSADGRSFAAGTDRGMSLWSGAATTATHLPGAEPITRFTFSADSRMLAAIVDGGQGVRVWSVPDGRLLLSAEPKDDAGSGGGFFSALFSPESDKLVVVQAPAPATAKMQVLVYAIAAGAIDAAPTRHSMQACPQFDFSYAAGGSKVGLSLNAKVCSFDIRRLAEGDAAATTAPGPQGGSVDDITISPDGRLVIRLLRRANEAQVANLATGELWRLQGAFDLPENTSYEASIAINGSGDRLAMRARDGGIRIFDLVGAGGPAALARWVSADEKLAVVPAGDVDRPFFELRDFETGRVLRRLDREGRFKSIRDFAPSADGKRLFAQGVRAGDGAKSLLGFDIRSDAPPDERPVDQILAIDHDTFLVQEGAEWVVYSGGWNAPVYRMPAPERDIAYRPRARQQSSLQFGNARLFAVQKSDSDNTRIEIFRIEAGVAKVARTIVRPASQRVDTAFQGGGRVMLLSDGRRTEVWDLSSPAAAAAFVLPDTEPRYVYAGQGSSLVIVRRPEKWEVRDLGAAGAVVETLAMQYHVDTNASYAWAPLANGRGIQVRNLANRAAPAFVVEGEEVTPEFSSSGGTMAVRLPRQNRVRIYKLPAATAAFEVDMGAFEASRLSDSGRYIFYRDGRLIPTDPAQLVKSAVANVKRSLNDDDWCQALRADASCRLERPPAPVAAAASTPR